jgi:hypothetical protein
MQTGQKSKDSHKTQAKYVEAYLRPKAYSRDDTEVNEAIRAAAVRMVRAVKRARATALDRHAPR